MKVNFEGDSEDLSNEEYAALESAFLWSYNELGADGCFAIEDIAIETAVDEDDNERRRRRLQNDGRALEDFTFNFSLIFSIGFRCYECLTGSSLFKNDGFRRRLSMDQIIDEFSTQSMNQLLLLQEQEEDSTNNNKSGEILIDDTEFGNNADERSLLQGPSCNPNSIGNCKGPERTTFTSTLNSAIQEFPDISVVQQVVETSELEFYECVSKTIYYDTTLTVELEGNYAYLESSEGPPDRETLDQIKILERGVKKAYNTINAQTKKPAIQHSEG